MQNRIQTNLLAVLVVSAFGLSGCSQISSLWKGKSKTSTITEADTLRSTPEQSYGFGDETAITDYSRPTMSSYAGYEVELYDTAPQYYYGSQATPHNAVLSASYSDPREAAFVKLNGQSESVDWQNCENLHQGYLYLSEYDFRLEPNFEVCMRNKGYVLTTELGSYSSQALTAQNSGLRGYAQSYSYAGSYYP